jgi:predicted SprT family Zn-dependent metalloprotease
MAKNKIKIADWLFDRMYKESLIYVQKTNNSNYISYVKKLDFKGLKKLKEAMINKFIRHMHKGRIIFTDKLSSLIKTKLHNELIKDINTGKFESKYNYNSKSALQLSADYASMLLKQAYDEEKNEPVVLKTLNNYIKKAELFYKIKLPKISIILTMKVSSKNPTGVGGVYRYNTKTKEDSILINRKFFNDKNIKQCLSDTVPHEVAHFVTQHIYGNVSSHGIEWKSVMIKCFGIKNPMSRHQMYY